MAKWILLSAPMDVGFQAIINLMLHRIIQT